MKNKNYSEDSKTIESIRVEFNDEEIGQMKDAYMKEGGNLEKLDDQLKAIKKDYKAKMDAIRVNQKELRSNATAGYIDQDMEVYNVPDYNKGIMEFVEVNSGEVVGTRKLKPAEKKNKLRNISNG